MINMRLAPVPRCGPIGSDSTPVLTCIKKIYIKVHKMHMHAYICLKQAPTFCVLTGSESTPELTKTVDTRVCGTYPTTGQA